MPDERGLFRFKKFFDEVYGECELRKLTSSSMNDTMCDGYGHHVNCHWIVQECKPSNIYESLIQLEESIKKLMHNGHNVDKAFIIVDKLSKNDKKRFKVNPKTRLLYPINGRNPITLYGGINIVVLEERDLSEEVVKWLFT